ncbi:hypothetical protein AOC36_08610 [Erysipelothrix larvae]|uniref:DUF4440 domain-containing protein n=1 Tax=Erysipelothrix larvae TaxID=1514105 RepID=A0A0X8H0X6_9FIRM|nr:nuclear transport factor 2 family protein [Erysipelothrix larvae]AMC94046.1 hypothetical protein AOC36_08610 [Erysipelothrix larvae]
MINTHETSNQLWTGLKTQDQALLTQVLHPNAIFVHMGATMTRDQEIDTVINKGIVYKDVTFEASTLHEYGDVSVLLNTLTLCAVVGNNEVTNRFVVTEVYKQSDTLTQCISMSFTKILY